MAHCMRHYEEPMEASCRTCQRDYCSRCLVFSFGPDKPPYCVSCALGASGVRNKSRVPVHRAPEPSGAERKFERARLKAERKQAKVDAKAQKQALKGLPAAPMAPTTRPTNVPAPAHMAMPAARYAPGMEQPVR